jgi:hypothetical protein
LIQIIKKLIRDIVFFFFIIIFTMIWGRVLQRVKWAIVQVVLRRGSFTGGAVVVRAERFIMAGSLALKTNSASHIHGEDFIDEQFWNLLNSVGR